MITSSILRHKTTLRLKRRKFWTAYAFLYEHVDQAGLIYTRQTDFVLKPEETYALNVNFSFMLQPTPEVQPRLVTINAGKVIKVEPDVEGWYVMGKIATPFDLNLQERILDTIESGLIRLTVSTLASADVKITPKGIVQRFPLAAWCIYGDPGDEEAPEPPAPVQ